MRGRASRVLAAPLSFSPPSSVLSPPPPPSPAFRLLRASLPAGAMEASSPAVGGEVKTTSAASKVIAEGTARLTVGSDVFYNNVQCVNRDMSIVALNACVQQMRVERDWAHARKEQGKPGGKRSVPTWTHWGVPPPEVLASLLEEGGSATGARDKAKAPARAPSEDGEGDDQDEEGEEESETKKTPTATPTPTSTTSSSAPSDPLVLHILEGLSASGLRSIRYAKEIAPQVTKKILANDSDIHAVESIRLHTTQNGPYENGTDIQPSHADAVDLMHSRRKNNRFDVVDLDPYGAPSEFLDSGVQCVKNGGILCVTATDLAVLAGSNMDKCRQKYGGMPLHRPYSHEMAIRLLLACIDSHANRWGRFIVPLLSLKLDFYVRVFVRVYDDRPNEVKRSMLRLAYVLQSKAGDAFRLLPYAELDGKKIVPARLDAATFQPSAESAALGGWMLGGPIWSAPIHNMEFVQACMDHIKAYKKNHASANFMKLQHGDRVGGILAAVKEELPDVPLYYSVSQICRSLHCTTPPMEKFQAAIMNAGYRSSQCHHDPGVLKTDAPSSVLWDILRCWIKKHPVSKKRLEEDSTMAQLLAVEPKTIANFDIPRALRVHNKARAEREGNNLHAKWAQNPEKFWGPKSKAGPNVKERPAAPNQKTSKRAASSSSSSSSSPVQKQSSSVAAAESSPNKRTKTDGSGSGE